jgi:hypothetical protein
VKMTEIFQRANVNIEFDDLLRIEHVDDEMLEGFAYLGKSPSDFYQCDKSFFPYCYYKGLTFVEIYSFNPHYLNLFKVREQIEKNDEYTAELIKEQKFIQLFSFLNEKILFSAYETVFNLIPDNQKYNLFLSIYTRLDYGFSDRHPAFVRHVFSFKASAEHQIKRELLLPFCDEDETLLVYRGEAGGSAHHDQSFSWSLNFKTACFFASRFGNFGQIVTANVHVNHVIDFVQHRNESEVLILPEHLYNHVLIPMLDADAAFKILEDNGFLDLYQYFCDKIKPSFFKHPDGIHGVLHTKRVLLHMYLLAKEMDLSDEDVNLLSWAVTYHDIGRVHDEEDLEHGFESVKKIESHSLPLDCEDEDLQIANFIMRYHAMDDEIGLDYLKGCDEIQDKRRAEKLFRIFKDADGLDRVRTGDLDPEYLRNEYAKRLILVAKEFFNHIT